MISLTTLKSIVLVILIIGAGILYLYIKDDQGDDRIITIDPNATSTTVGGYTIERITDTDLPAPSYTRRIVYKADVSADVRTALEVQQADIKRTLDVNNDDYNAWLRLGTLYHLGGDYKYAVTIWTYIAAAWNNDPVALYNLGNEYVHLGRQSEAEASYKKAIANGFRGTDAFRALFELQAKTNSSAAESTLKQGIETYPTSLELQVMLARYYKQLGKLAEARDQYDFAITTAKSTGHAEAASDLEIEKNNL